MNNSRTPAPASLAHRLLLWRVLAVTWAFVIFQLSTASFRSSITAWLLARALAFIHVSVSPATFETLHFLIRKLAHLTEYAVFSLLLYHSFREGHEGGWRGRPALWAVLLAALYALTDEFHQSFVPGRTASLTDCEIDTFGAFLGIGLLYGHHRLIQDRE